MSINFKQSNYKPAELGFLAVLSVEAIHQCLELHSLIPKLQKKIWDDLWKGVKERSSGSESGNYS